MKTLTAILLMSSFCLGAEGDDGGARLQIAGEPPAQLRRGGIAMTCHSATNFNLAAGVIWKKFRKIKDKYVLGKPAEGNALAIFRISLRSRNAELAAEARTILEAIEATRDILGERLEQARADGCPDAEDWIRLYLKSYPSRKKRFTAQGGGRKECVSGNGL